MDHQTPLPLLVVGNLADNWKIFKQNFLNYIQAPKIRSTSAETHVAILLNLIGEDGLRIFNTLNLTESQVNDLHKVLDAMEAYCTESHRSDIVYKRSVFNQRCQGKDETFDAFLLGVKTLAKECGFGVLENVRIKDRIVMGLRDLETRDKLEKIKDLTLENAISFCRASESMTLSSNKTEGVIVLQHQVSSKSTDCVLATECGSQELEYANMKPENMCGMSFWHPSWLQKFANSKTFLIVYGLLGTTQAMGYLYFVVSLTTIEKRFKIPSQTTGIILSGNEISQILLSLILSYAGGQRNRPRWIAWGVVFCALSCFILVLPHFIYGPGEEALQLTQEYKDLHAEASLFLNSTVPSTPKGTSKLCLGLIEDEECDELFSIVPLVLIFMSQFVLGIGNTMYYALGQTYLDDNTKKTNTPMMLAYAMSLRMFGPVVGFVLGYFSLKVYIDPTKTPLINNKDPRWLGAWWLGWIILGFSMLIFAALIGMFPKHLPKKKVIRDTSETPRMAYVDEDIPFRSSEIHHFGNKRRVQEKDESPKMKDFPVALMRLLKNKILMFNILSTIFYILGSSGYITFLSKYMEVQFNKNSADASIITGPITIIGMVSGFLLSGYIISKYKPSPRKLFFWNVIVGLGYMAGQVSYIFLSCDNNYINNFSGTLNLTAQCNTNCSCTGVAYSPVCYEPTSTTFFSPCHAGCNRWDDKGKYYDNCACATDNQFTKPVFNYSTIQMQVTEIFRIPDTTTPDRKSDTTDFTTSSMSSILTPNIPSTTVEHQYEPLLFKTIINTTDSPPEELQLSEEQSTSDISYTEPNDNESEDTDTAAPSDDFSETDFNTTEEKLSRQERSANDNENSFLKMVPGACLAGCAQGFYLFTIISFIINWFGATGRIGNILLNFRVVLEKDKAMSQGLALMLVSLFALIPGPIIYGYIIDGTCSIWNYKCGKRGNCQLYNTTQFRYNVNLAAMMLTLTGVTFDVLVWYYSKNIDLYGEGEQKKVSSHQDRIRKPISPLLSKKPNDR
ncbi:solute carrier organic anion transporter family member 74D isoform X2 [Bradysia coprophila]|uniref:solute carrier organic anion transporter family member 74D isoform X2 n=1 Tax=Bradysia coprophila TaxID=38358 RepID=UPI00187D8CF1|nr:solute carrier organic anion transporter family member 74D isoform X2 [Bradysia coprophila]